MDKRIKNFLIFSTLLVLLFILIAAVFTFVYRNFTLNTYNTILFGLIILVAVLVVVIAYAMLAVLYAYKKRAVGTALLIPVRLGLKIVIPFTIFITGVFKKNKDAIRSLFIDINNIIVESAKYLYRPEQILVILPHCLQNSNCSHKITGSINNCRQCGKCTIGTILSLVKQKAVRAAVVTGGTAAQNLVLTEKPEVILSVACERDLAIGIADISRIPVIGIVNERPNGPCKDTCVNVELLGKKLDSLLLRTKEVIK